MNDSLKMYFVCDGKNDWWICWGVLSNGFCFGHHVCSNPEFAPSDLYFRRQERISALRELFGVTPETVQSETIVVQSKADIPDWWDSHGDLQDGLKVQYNRYKELLDVWSKCIPLTSCLLDGGGP